MVGVGRSSIFEFILEIKSAEFVKILDVGRLLSKLGLCVCSEELEEWSWH